MNEFVVRNKWALFGAVLLAFAALAMMVGRGSDEDSASNDLAQTSQPESPPLPVITRGPTADDADADADDDDNASFASDDDLIQNPEGEDPSAGLDDSNSDAANAAAAATDHGDPPPSDDDGSGDQSDGGDN